MNFAEVIARKRDGHRLAAEDIQAFVTGAATGSLPPEQLAAMLMAVYLRGMDPEETLELTTAMTDSGETWELARDLPDAVDKHSTGGIGDTVSLVFAPLMVAAGQPVVMMAGRGLGHTQGTLDKLEAIPGFDIHADRREALRRVDRCGAALVAQSESIAPADRVLYALRDLTATVGCLPLIVGSIMSKKLAMGAGALVLDVKFGTGAFVKGREEAAELARQLRAVARGAGMRCEAVVSAMDEPLAPWLGTACEVREVVRVLRGEAPGPLLEVTLELARRALGMLGESAEGATRRLEQALSSGAALRAWEDIVRCHGGDPDPSLMAEPVEEIVVSARHAGRVCGIDGESLGWLAVALGAGRSRRSDAVDPAAGVRVEVRLGDQVDQGQPLATLLPGRRAVDLDAARARVRDAIRIGAEAPRSGPLVAEVDDEQPRPEAGAATETRHE